MVEQGTILFVDGCPRTASRTRLLAEALLSKLKAEADGKGAVPTGWQVETVSPAREELPTLDEAALEKRTAACKEGRFDDPLFRYARQFAAADVVVIAAPFWDLSFPACLKKYAEAISVTGLTFRYNEQGVPVGLCRARKLYYVTTSGGPIFCKEFGYGYWEALAKGLYGIPDTRLITAENLDIWGNDPDDILAKAIENLQL